MPKEHEIKLSSKYFDDVKNGTKTFEIRKNDRDYNINDILVMREYTENKEYTGRYLEAVIIYILNNESFLQKDYVALGINIVPPFLMLVTES